MICADTSVFIEFFRGKDHPATELLQRVLEEKQALMSPFVLAELLSSPKLPRRIEKYLLLLPRIELGPRFFEDAGFLRRELLRGGKSASSADVYIAQSCIDAELPLLTLDDDFVFISEYSDLTLVSLQ